MLKSKIKSKFHRHDCTRIYQGDILRDYKILKIKLNNEVEELQFPYLIIITQDCDIKQCFVKHENKEEKDFNQFIPNILVTPAFSAEEAREGNHLFDLFQIKHTRINTDKWKIIKNNNNFRYHYLSEPNKLQVPDLLIDFKSYFTIPFEIVYENYKHYYLASVNELFREDLNQRFCFYLNRIALPDIENMTGIKIDK